MDRSVMSLYVSDLLVKFAPNDDRTLAVRRERTEVCLGMAQ